MTAMPNPQEFDRLTDDADPDAPRRELRLGAIIAGLFFVGLLGWAALTPLDAGALAQGVVAVSGNRQAVQHRDGGIVTELNVVEGQEVAKGDVLLRISASELVAAERGLTGEVLALRAQRARLIAERDGLDDLREPVEFVSLSPADAMLAQEAMRGQRQLFHARRNAMRTERGVLGQRMVQQERQIGGFRHQISSNVEQQRLLRDELTGLQSLTDRGFVSMNRIRAMQRGEAQLSGEHGALQAQIARTEAVIGEAQLQIVSIERQMLEEVATHLRDAQVRLDELLPRLVAARERLAQSVVRAPAGGRVVGLRLFTVGGVAAPGETLMEIVPQDRALVIEAKAAPTDADDLYPGMETQVRFTGLQERNLPILMGRISRVSADSFEDERSGQRHFKIEVAVPPEELARIRAVRGNSGLRAGLPAEVMVPLRKRTAFAYLIEPLTEGLWRAGREH